MMASPEDEDDGEDEMVRGKSSAAQAHEDDENEDEYKDEEAMLCFKGKSFCIFLIFLVLGAALTFYL